jgi:hypothetical protein
MDGGRKQKERTEMIKRQVKENATGRRERQVLQSMDEPFVVTSDQDFRTASQPASRTSETHGENQAADGGPGTATKAVMEPMTGPESYAGQSIALPTPTPGPVPWSAVGDGSVNRSPANTLVGPGSNDRPSPSRTETEFIAFPARDQELSSLNLGRETETEFVLMFLDYVHPFLFPFYRPPMLESGRHWLLNLIRTSQVAFNTAVSLGSYFFTIALGDTLSPEQRRTCRSLLWGQLARQTSLALKKIQADMGDIATRGPSDSLVESARVVGSIIQQIVVEVTIKRSADWSVHLTPTVSLFKDIFEYHGTPSGYPDLVHLLDQMPDPPTTMVGDNPLPHTADRTAFTFFTAVLLFIDVIASTSLDEPPQLAAYHGYLLASDGVKAPIRLESVFGCQNFVLLAIKDTSALSAWKKGAKQAGNLSVVDLVQRAEAISAALEAGIRLLDGGSAKFDPDIGVTLAGHFRGYYRRLEHRKQDHMDIEMATRIWALAARIYLAVVVSGWQPANAGIRADVARALELLAGIEEPGRIRAFAWPLCVVGCLAEVGQEEQVRQVAATMGDLKEFGTVGQVIRIVEAVWAMRRSVDRDTWDVAACLNVLGSPVLLI